MQIDCCSSKHSYKQKNPNSSVWKIWKSESKISQTVIHHMETWLKIFTISFFHFKSHKRPFRVKSMVLQTYSFPFLSSSLGFFSLLAFTALKLIKHTVSGNNALHSSLGNERHLQGVSKILKMDQKKSKQLKQSFSSTLPLVPTEMSIYFFYSKHFTFSVWVQVIVITNNVVCFWCCSDTISLHHMKRVL